MTRLLGPRIGIDSLWRGLLIIALVFGCTAPATFADQPAGTFIVANGASPWYDRVGNWALTQVPASLDGVGPLPQQSCSSRALTIPGTPKSIVIGVSVNDVPKFLQNVPTAAQSGENISVVNKGGQVIPYNILTLSAPPATIPDAGGYGVGLLLLSIDGASYKPAAAPSNGDRAAALPISASVPTPTLTPSTPAVPVKLPKKSDLRIYVLMGQSNMVGRDTSQNNQQVDNPRILALDPTGKWVVAHEPMHAGGTGIGPGISFAATMLKSDRKIVIGLVPCAVGGTPLSRWVKGGDLYERAIQRTQLAENDGILSGVLWHQGESDSDNSDLASTYGARLTQMFVDLRTDLNSPNLPIVVGEMGKFLTGLHPYVETIRTVEENMPKTLPNVGFAPSNGLVDKGDHLHFNAVSQIEFGARYAAAMLALQKHPQPQTVSLTNSNKQ